MKGWAYLESRFGVDREEFLELSKICESLYHVWDEPKETGGYRRFHKPAWRLRRAQDIIKLVLNTFGEFGEPAHAYRKGKSNISHTLPHKGRQFKLIVDIRGFFPSITSEKIERAIYECGISHSVAKVITALVTVDGGLPQGTPTSPVLSNMVMKEIDKRVAQLASQLSIRYTRYSDDIVFSAQWDFRSESHRLVGPMIGAGYVLHPSKTIFKIGPTEMTGIVIKNNYLRVPDRVREKLEGNTNPKSISALKHYISRVQTASSSKRTS